MPTFAVFMIRRAIIVVRNIYKQKTAKAVIAKMQITQIPLMPGYG